MEKDKTYIYKEQELIFIELINNNGWFYRFQNKSLNPVLVLCKDFYNDLAK